MWGDLMIRLIILVTVLSLLEPGHGAAIIENQTGTWAAGGLGDYFARASDNILPDELLQQVMKEVEVFEKYEKEERARSVEGGAYMHGKGGTFWRPLFTSDGKFTKPRFAIEAAIQLIYKKQFGDKQNPRILGGEWWIQRRDPREDIGFHHDKDESLASNQMTMKFPEISTVTYLSDIGGPTLIFNQTTPDGNREEPCIPSRGFLSYPKMNRHMMFRGNLQHGVPGELALSESSEVSLRGAKRTTLLINWWNTKPLGPNCNKVDTKLAKSLGVYNMEEVTTFLKSDAAKKHKPVPVEFEALFLPSDKSLRQRHYVTLAGGDAIWYDLPKARRNAGFQIEWEEDQIFGNGAILDLNSPVVRNLFSNPAAKLIIFQEFNEKPYTSAPQYALALAKKHHEQIKVVFADPRKTKPAMDVFGVTMQDVPIAVIHETTPLDRKYLPPESARSLNKKNLEKMVELYLGGKLRVVGGNDAEEVEP